MAELQQLAELSRKSVFQADENQMNSDKLEKERLQKEVIDLRKELSIVIATKVELEEIHQENVDKVQVELVASQKMYQISEDELYKLKIQNENLRMDLKQAKDLITKYRDEIGAVQAQVMHSHSISKICQLNLEKLKIYIFYFLCFCFKCEVFRNDFELERKAREEMAHERDQMIADMKLLKKRNHALVDEAQS